jgi:hypothetical protein
MVHLGLSINLSGDGSTGSAPPASLFLTFTTTLASLSGDDPLNSFVTLSPTFTITSTPSPINIKYAVISGTSPVVTKIQYSKNGGGFVDTTENTNFADTFVNGDTLQIRVQGNGFGSDTYFFELQNGSSTTISNFVQVVASFES